MTAAADPREALGSASRRTATLDGLRGIAVLAVVIEHAWPGLLPGGFAGVDVFFVLSGYLITGILVRELRRTGSIGLVDFYARRVRRIIPAAVLCVVGTWLLFTYLLGPMLPESLPTEAVAATVSVSNILFAQNATDYFAADPASSPYLHFWSLAVEEQFYLVWPSLLLALVWVARRIGAGTGATTAAEAPRTDRADRIAGVPKRWLPVVAVAMLGGVSLVLAMRSPQTDAFFLLPHRGWELIVGGLLVWLQQEGLRLPAAARPFRAVGVIAGIAALALVFVAAPDFGPWPGVATVIAVGGTALLVAGGDDMPGARLFANTPLMFLGRISYALYLWHWPLLAAAAVLALPAATAPLPLTIGAVVAATVIATISTLLVEEPIRGARVRWLVGRRAIGVGVAGLAAVAVSVATLTPSLVAATAPTPAGEPPGTAGRPGATDGAPQSGDGGLRLVDMVVERERLIEDHCHTTATGPIKPRDCVYGADARPDGSPIHGDPTTPDVAVLFGDSHAMHWFPAIDAWARENGLALVPLVRSGCTAIDAERGRDEDAAACVRWRDAAVERIAELDPLVTVVSSSTGVPFVEGRERIMPRERPERLVAPLASMLERLAAIGGDPLLLVDVPRPGFEVPDCLGVHRRDLERCSLPLDETNPPALREAQAQAAETAGVPFADPSAWLCPDGTCTWIVNDHIGWVDDHHITAAASRAMLPHLEPVLDAVLAGRGGGAALNPP